MASQDFSIANQPHARKQGASPGMITNFIQASARAWKLPFIAIVLLLVAPFVVILIGVLSALMGKATYLWVAGEDGLAENIQVVLFGLTFLLGLLVARRYWQAGYKLITFLYLFLCIGLVFLIGEEISWGQRIFGWETTGMMAEINTQNETNIHNISGFKTAFKWVQMLVGAYGLLLPLIIGRWRDLPGLRELWAAIVPHRVLIPYFGLMFFWKFYRNLFEAPAHWEFALAEYNEILELVLAMGLFLFMVFQLRRDRSA